MSSMKHIHHTPKTTDMFEYDEYKREPIFDGFDWSAAIAIVVIMSMAIGALSALV